MSLRLPKFDRQVPIVDDSGKPLRTFHIWWERVVNSIITAFNDLEEIVLDIQAAQQAADDAQAAAEAAQQAADDAQAAVDAIVVPASGSRTVSTSGPVTNDDGTILANASGGAITLTLAAAATFDHIIRIQKVDSSANVVTIDGNGSETINGNPTLALTVQYQVAQLVSDGTSEWYSS